MLKDYIEMVWKPYRQWARKHWKGYLMLIVTCCLIWYVVPYVVNRCLEKIEKRRKEIKRLEP